MALFVFGAGATRGASFVDSLKNPCLPPLDGDFFTQLQKVKNTKKSIIDTVINDVVDIFGQNFNVTMETVFSTLEHTIKMIEVTGDNRYFRKAELLKKRERLLKTIQLILREALTVKRKNGFEQKKCCVHRNFVSRILNSNDQIISFNYDCLLDFALKNKGDGKWNAHYGYGFSPGRGGKLIEGDDYWQPTVKADKADTVMLYKVHGSLHFDFDPSVDMTKVILKKNPYVPINKQLKFTIIPPEWHKSYDKGVFSVLWKYSAKAIKQAEHVIFIGYSLPLTDMHSTALFRTSIKPHHLKSLVVVNPDQKARQRTRDVLQKGLDTRTRVLSFDKFEEFVKADPSIWRVY